MSEVKIFSTQRIDKECDYIDDDILIPVRCGAVFDTKKSTIIGDNTGGNISEKRKTYCELTTQYWAWKNVKADYYGFCHYRRYFAFKYDKKELDAWNTLTTTYLDEWSKERYNFSSKKVRKIIEKYDVITPIPCNLQKVNIQNVREQYKTGQKLHIEDLDLVVRIIEIKFPKYAVAARKYLAGNDFYMCNMFVLKRELFKEYSQFLFSVLEEFERQADMKFYSEEGMRTPGHLGERLFGIFVTYLKMQGDYKIGQFPICNIAEPETVKPLSKKFDKESVNIVFSTSEYFAPYCATTIRSIIKNANPKRCYDIVVLEQELQKKTKKRIESLMNGNPNISIRFYNVKRLFQGYQLRVVEHFSVETYFRLVIPNVLSSYDKVLYLDSDLIAKTDVGELFDTDITDFTIAAAIDVVGEGIVNGFNDEKIKYYKKYVRLKNYREQLNGGVLLLNLPKIREQYSTEELLRFAALSNFDLADQDVLNSLFQGQIKWLDLAWNASNDEEGTLRAYVATFASADHYEDYKMAIKEPKIIHYAGTIKPWHDPNYQFAEEFWNTLRETPFYDIVMYRRIVENAEVYSWNAVKNIPITQPQNNQNSIVIKEHKTKKGIIRTVADVVIPKGTKRRETLKKAVFAIIGKEYVTPYYMLTNEDIK